MMHIMKNRKNGSHIHSYKKRLLAYILAPVALSLLFFMASNLYLLDNIQEHLLSQCWQGHQAFSSAYESEFYSLHQNSMLLLENDTVKDLYTGHETIFPKDNYKFLNVVQALSTFNSTKPYLRRTGFISENNNRFVSSSCTSFLEDFYGNSYYGHVINQENYLKNYEKMGCIYQIQPLDSVDPAYSQPAIPLLQYQIGSYRLTSPLILYLSKTNFSQSMQTYRMSDGAELFIYCPATDQIIGSTNALLEQELLSLIQDGHIYVPQDKESQDIAIDGLDYSCLVSVSQTSFVDPLYFISLIPRRDILSQTTLTAMLSTIFLFVCVILSCILGYLLSFRLYHPIENLMQVAGKSPVPISRPDSQERTGDEINYLNKHITSLQDNNTVLRTHMDTALPMLYTQYIINILEQREYNNKMLEPLFSDYSTPFFYPYFTCSILTIRLLPRFYSDFTQREQAGILQQFNSILEMAEDASCVKCAFLLSSSKYCIISNAPESDHEEILRREFEGLLALFSFDKDYIQFYIACGSTYEGIRGLQQSWKQANAALSYFSAFGKEYLHFYHHKPPQKEAFSMETGDDNKLLQYLVQRNTQATNELVTEIVARNQQKDLGEQSFKDLYVHLYELGETVLRQEHISPSALLGEHYLGLSLFVHDLTNLERSEYILLFYQSLCQRPFSEAPSTSFDLKEIKRYVDEHYLEDIYLESLAAQFNTSPKYMSRILKNALGMPFKQYLNVMRITRAKELLIEDDKKIEEIMLLSGFNSRNSFIRTFKQLTGIAPSEYRNLYHK